jgi:hypothetical protein
MLHASIPFLGIPAGTCFPIPSKGKLSFEDTIDALPACHMPDLLTEFL